MRATIFDILSFCVVLVGTMLFMDADVLNRQPKTSIPQNLQEDVYGNSFILAEGQGNLNQNLLLPISEEEQRRQEQYQSASSGGVAAYVKSFFFASKVFYSEKLHKNSFLSFSNLFPIYLKVLSLRL